ncbi:MAG: hypothetical protein JAY97_09230 [Candidatus Thiodiazotropha sp. 'RUGA']|nr:hypothetical protein [Candidatus Thiodiazotropha sp. 'RUGA']
MIKIRVIAGIMMFLLSNSGYAIALKADAAIGYDNNPFRLNDSFSSQDGKYLYLKLKANQKFGNGFNIKASSRSRNYNSSKSDANQILFGLGAMYKQNMEIHNKKSTVQVEAGFKLKDKTYVSRFSGDVGEYGGNDISDRYDYNSFSLNASFDLRITKKLITEIGLKHRNRDYEDFNITGLSNLDYSQYYLTNDWTYKQNKKNRYDFKLYLGTRNYDDKREKNLNGNEIAGSDLEYDYFGVSIGHRYKVDKNISISWELKYQDRKDSGSGYYDMDEIIADIGIKYRFIKNWRFIGSLLYIDRNYPVRISISDENDIQSPDKQGYAIKFRFERDLPEISKYDTRAYIGMIYEDYDSDEPAYVYDRMQVMTGIKINLSI